MRNWVYILVFFVISAHSYAECGPEGCFQLAPSGPSARGPELPDIGAKFGNSDFFSNAGREAARIGQREALEEVHAIDRRVAELDSQLKTDPSKAEAINKEKAELKKKKDEFLRKLGEQALQEKAGQTAAGKNAAGQQQAKSDGGGGMPMMPPGGGGGDKGDEGGGDKNELKAPTVPTPAPQPTPPAVAAKATEILSDADYQKMLAEANTPKVSEGTSATAREIAEIQQKNAALQAEIEAANALASANRAAASLDEMKQTPTARTGTMLTSTGGKSSTNTSGSPFDLSPKNPNGAPTMNAVQTASTSAKKPTTGTTSSSGATMTAVKISSNKEQASSRLLASATGSAGNSELTVTPSTASGVVRSGVVTKPKTSGPVYGMRPSSTRVGVYKNMTVPKALQTEMNQRIAVVGGSTPQNHSPQLAAQPAAKPSYYTDGATSRMRAATQPVSAHLGR